MSARSIHKRLTLRRGFTLVELLVVMGIIALLAGIGVYAYQPFQQKSAVNNSGVMLQSWITAAKQRALRDQIPRGIRLLPGDEYTDDSGGFITYLVTKCVFIEPQEDLTGTIRQSAGQTQLTTTTAIPPSDTIVATDYAFIEINGGLLQQVTSASGTNITLAKPLPYSIPLNSGATFRIFRSPKAVTNSKDTTGAATEDILRLPTGAAIHLKANTENKAYGYDFTPSPAVAPIDIMFTPNGSVMIPAPHNDKIVLWVTGTQRSQAGVFDPRQGQPNLVVVNTRTGFISGYQVALDWNAATKTWNAGTDPYSFVR